MSVSLIIAWLAFAAGSLLAVVGTLFLFGDGWAILVMAIPCFVVWFVNLEEPHG